MEEEYNANYGQVIVLLSKIETALGKQGADPAPKTWVEIDHLKGIKSQLVDIAETLDIDVPPYVKES